MSHTAIESLSTTSQPTSRKRWGERDMVKGFAVFGALCLVFQAYLYTRWIFSSDFARIDGGPDRVPTHMLIAVYGIQIVMPILFLLGFYKLVIRPYREERRVPAEGLYFLAMLFIYWNTCTSNFFKPAYTWNTAFFNRGSWYGFIPGWQSPNGNGVAEPILMGPFLFSVGIVLFALPMIKLMQAIKSRRPHWSGPRLYFVAFLIACVFEIILEIPLSRMGIFTFAGTVPGITIFQGHYYQFPINEIFMFAATTSGMVVPLLFFRNDKGETLAELGLSRIQTSPRKRAVLRFVAIVGVANFMQLGYNVLYTPTTLLPSFQWARDTVERSYFRDGVCGGTTGIACPGFEGAVSKHAAGR